VSNDNVDLNDFVRSITARIQGSITNRAAPDPLALARSIIASNNSPMPVAAPDRSQSPGLGSRILDLLARPSYAVNNTLNEAAKSMHGTDIGRPSWEVPDSEQPNYARAVGRGLAGKDKTSFANVLATSDPTMPAGIRGTLGFIGDVGLDPLSYVGIPGASKLAGLNRARNSFNVERDLAEEARRAADVPAIPESPTPETLPAPVMPTGAGSGSLADIKKGSTGKLDQSVLLPERTFAIGPSGGAADVIETSVPRTFTNAKSLTKLTEGRNAAGNQPNFAVTNGDLTASRVATDRVAAALDDLNAIRYPKLKQEGVENIYTDPTTTDIITKSQSHTRNKEVYRAWAEKYKDQMDPSDYDYLTRARNYTSFANRANHVINKMMDRGAIRSIDDFVEFAKNGHIDEASIARMMNATGAQRLEDVPSLAKDIFARHTSLEAAAKKSKVVPNKIAQKAAEIQSAVDAAVSAGSKRGAERAVQPRIDSGEGTALAEAELPDNELAAALNKQHTGEYPPKDQAQQLIFHTSSTRARLADQNLPRGKAEAQVRKEVTDQMRLQQNMREASGQKSFIKSRDGEAWPLGLADILQTLPDVAKKFHFTPNTAVKPDELMAGAAKVLDLVDSPLMLEEKVARVASEMRGAVPQAKKLTSDKILADAATQLVYNEGALQHALTKSMLRQGGKDLKDSVTLANAAKSDIVDGLADTGISSGEKMELIANVGKYIGEAGDTIGASPAAKMRAGADAAETLAKTTEPTAAAVSNTALKVRTALMQDGRKAIVRVRETVQKLGDDLAEDGEKLVPEEAANDLDVLIGSRMDNRYRGFTGAVGNATGLTRNPLREVIRSGSTAAATEAAMFHSYLNKLAKIHAKPQRDAAFNMIREGVKLDRETFSRLDSDVLRAYNDYKPVVDRVFNIGDESKSLLGTLFRNGDGVDEINKVMKEYHIKQKFDLEGAGGNLTDMANQWREWKIDGDPFDLMDRMFSAMSHLNAKRSVVQEITGLYGVKAAKRPAGDFVKLDIKSMSELGPHMDADVWYPRRVAEGILDVDKVIASATSFHGDKGALAGFMNNIVDPVLSIWKPWVTIARPGHHVRNIIGDLFMTRADPLNSRSFKDSHRIALKVMTASGRMKKNPEQLMKFLSGEEIFEGPLAHALTLKGKALSNGDIYKSALERGLLPEYRLGQDLVHDLGDMPRTQKLQQMLTENRMMTMFGKFSESYSHELRLAHYVGLLKSDKFVKQFKTVEDAMQGAVERVRRYHPDVTGLTPAEQKYMRRFIPFYSWIRQAIPIVMSTAMTRPGRITELPKGFYNAQIAMGQNPDSMIEPFDNANLYPSFIRDNLTGPVFGDVGLNLGSPTEGVLGDIANGNPGRNVLSMLNPVIKSPIEMVSGTNMGTGAPILDYSDYIDSNIPIVNQVAAISGTSPAGTIGHAMVGQGDVPDPQRQVAIGNKQRFWNQNLANYFLGLGIEDYNKPNYQRIATREIGGSQ
jgi:hypothetical protein